MAIVPDKSGNTPTDSHIPTKSSFGRVVLVPISLPIGAAGPGTIEANVVGVSPGVACFITVVDGLTSNLISFSAQVTDVDTVEISYIYLDVQASALDLGVGLLFLEIP